MANGGDVIFNFKGDDKGLAGTTKKALGSIKSLGSGALKIMGVATAAIATQIEGVILASVSARGEIEQQIGGTEAVFGKYAKNVQEMSKKAYNTMGTSANDYMATINKMGSLMKGSGIDTKTSMDLSSKAMQRAADVASVMGIDTATAMESIAGAAKGNFTMMDNLGVAMNATTLESYALSKGINKSYKEMSNAEKIQLAMEMFLEKSSFAAGNYAKENKTLAGSITTLKASWQNFLSGAGDLGQVLEAGLGAFDSIARTMGEAIPSIIENILTYLPQFMQTGTMILDKLLSGLTQNLPKIIEAAITVVQSLTTWLIQNLPTIISAGTQLLFSLVQGFASAMPTFIPQCVEAVMTIVEGLIDNIDMLIDAGIELVIGIAEGLINAIPQLLEKVPIIIEKLTTKIIGSVDKLITSGIKLIVNLGVGLIKAIPQLVSKIPQIITAIVKGLANGLKPVTQVGVNLVKGLWNGISNVTSWLWSKISGFASGILKKIKGLFGIHSPSKVFRDEIGSNLALGLGEGFTDEMGTVSKEMNKAMSDIGFGDMFELSPTLNKTMSASSNVNVQVINNMETDLLGNLVNNIRTYSNGSKNDYNYGMAY